MKTTVTLTLDADLLREVRSVAADERRSIGALLIDQLQAIVRERKAFDKARRRALRRLSRGPRPAVDAAAVSRPASRAIARQKGPEKHDGEAKGGMDRAGHAWNRKRVR